MKKAKRVPIAERHYMNLSIIAGLVKNSPHKENTVYLTVGDKGWDLTAQEALTIIHVLSDALFALEHDREEKK